MTAVRHTAPAIRLGLRENIAQFSLLVVVNAFVGAMVGMERSILPLLAEQEFQLAARTAILSFIVVFGVTKALTNYLAGRFADRVGRRQILIAGWLVAAPVPFLLMWAPTWTWVLVANGLLGISQGFTWSTTVIMKIDLVGPERRGLAMGLNEFAGYIAVAGAALATGWVAAQQGLRPEPFYLGVLFVIFGLGLSLLLVRETESHVTLESRLHSGASDIPTSADLLAHDNRGSQSLEHQPGRARQQPERRHGMGPVSLVLCGCEHEPGANGSTCSNLPGHVGCRAARNGRTLRPYWTQVADRHRYVDAGGRHRRHRGVRHVPQVRGGRCVAGCRNRDGLPDAPCWYRRRRFAILARVGDWCVPLLARSRLRDRCRDRWRDGRPARFAWCVWIVAGLTFISGLIVAFRMRETLAAASVGQRRNLAA